MKKYFLATAAALAGIIGFSLTALAAPTLNGAKVTGPYTIVVNYSVPVNTSFGDYGNFTGSLAGRTLASLSGNGTAAVTLTFTGIPFATDAHGTMTVASTTVASSDNSAFADGTVTVTDAQMPQLTSFTVNAASASSSSGSAILPQAGDTITLTFAASESVVRPPITIAGHTVYPNGTDVGPYAAIYTLTGSDTAGSVPFSFNLADLAGNSAPIKGSLSLNGSASAATPASATTNTAVTSAGPTLTQITPIGDGASATPTYTFSSTEAGTINYSGDCLSSKTAAIVGTNAVTFNTLSNTVHNNCVITVTDSSGKTSNTIFIPPFTVGSATNTPAAPAAAAPALANDGFKFTKFLQAGMTNNDVLELQKRLTVEGFFTGPVTGKFGAQTLAAVKAYQKAHGLDQKGWVGPGTRAALNQ